MRTLEVTLSLDDHGDGRIRLRGYVGTSEVRYTKLWPETHQLHAPDLTPRAVIDLWHAYLVTEVERVITLRLDPF